MAAAGDYYFCHNYKVHSPGKAWNVITVGAYDDHNTTDWSDDTMYTDTNEDGNSCYVNPSTGTEKPEVAAPGKDVTAIGYAPNHPGNSFGTRPGTSMSAPQVAGLAALLMQNWTALRVRAEAIKAMIMASAVHNIEGDSRLSDKDGAGGIDASLAEMAARTRGANDSQTVCTGPCWWGNLESIAAYGTLSRHFYASRGEHLRVAVSWMSNATCYDVRACDQLNEHLRLDLLRPSDGSVLVTSATNANNYQIVEVVAPDTGNYEIRVTNTQASTFVDDLGIAWVKDATYLPDLRNYSSSSGWVSRIFLRNEGSAGVSAYNVYYNDASGAPLSVYVNGTPTSSDQCLLSPGQACPIPMNDNSIIRIPDGQVGSAIVSGGENVSVLVENDRSSPNEADAYDGVAAAAPYNPGWGQAGTTLYAPVVMTNYYGWFGQIKLFNAGAGTVNFTIYYYDGTGTNVGQAGFSLPAHSRGGYTFSPGTTNVLYSARIVADQPLAGTVNQYNAGQSIQASYNLFSGGGLTAYGANFMNRYYGWDSSVNIQNVSSSPATLDVRYYNQNGTQAAARVGVGLAARATVSYFSTGEGLPNGWAGAVKVTSTQPVALVVNASSPDGGTANRVVSYSGAQEASRSVVLPNVVNYYDDQSWVMSLNLYNPSAAMAVVWVDYAGSQTPINVAAGGYEQFYIPSYYQAQGLSLPALLTSSQPIVVAPTYTSSTNPNVDFARSYPGVNR